VIITCIFVVDNILEIGVYNLRCMITVPTTQTPILHAQKFGLPGTETEFKCLGQLGKEGEAHVKVGKVEVQMKTEVNKTALIVARNSHSYSY